jgi:TATA-box binding protein (TBP) (component of TFIID and TFIIIB)
VNTHLIDLRGLSFKMEKTFPYRISTITATGSVNTELNLDVFYDEITIVDEDQKGVVYAEYGKKKSETVYKGFAKKFLVNKRKEVKTTKRFDNQVTIIYRLFDDQGKNPNTLNIKCFRNGNVQITGIKYINQGHDMVDALIDMLRSIQSRQPSIVKDASLLKNNDYRVRLINSDFKIGFDIKREWFYKMFMTNYNNECSFEPCIYPGVKIQYFWNAVSKCKNGLCPCENECIVGKGNGCGDGNCKRITIAIFQSGCVIITGAQNYEQINDAYKFISTVLLRHRNEIEKKVVKSDVDTKEKKIILINKKNIQLPEGWIGRL